MTDPLERSIAGVDGPRALDPAFRARLERAILDDTSPGIAAPAATGRRDSWAIDGPRELTPRFRARLEGAMLRRPRTYPPFVTTVAAAVSVIMIATGVVFVADRAGRPGKSSALPILPGPTTPPAVATKAPAAAKPSGSLRGFSSPVDFLRYVRGEALKVVGPYGIGSVGVYGRFPAGGVVTGPAPGGVAPGSGGPGRAPVLAPNSPVGGSDFSATNVQEEGVDEPDLVKTDGKRLAVVSGSDLRLLDVTKGTARLRGSVPIQNGLGAFLAGGRVIVFSQLHEAPPEARKATHVKQRPWLKVTVVDIDDLSKPKALSEFQVEGSYVGARMANGVVRLIIQSGALGPQPVELTSYSRKAQDAAKAGNKSAILRSVVGDWMPHFVVHRRSGATTTGHVNDWSAVSRPPDRSGVSMLTILTIDPANPRPDNAQSVMGAGEIVYSSLESLYVTSYALDDVLAVRESKRPKEPLTRIHKFDVSDPATARYVGSGEVAGFLLNQFSMSEHNGYLRVATTTGNQWVAGAPSSESAVTVLAEKAGKLVSVGSVGNLGLGERIFSVRFIGSMGYVVTFRQIDPLFVIDLRKPARPRVRGKLKIEGFSEYLHPISENLLLGVGREADKQGVAKGLQFSLFDVSDPAKPRRLHNHIEGPYGYSGVGSDHHAFLYWEPRRLIVVNASVSDTWSDHTDFIGALALTVSSSQGFGEPIRLTHVARPGVPKGSYPDIQRSLVIGNRLLTVSSSGVLVSDLFTLDDRAWVPFES